MNATAVDAPAGVPTNSAELAAKLAGPRRIDIGARRRARAEARDEPAAVVVIPGPDGDETFELPAELPLNILEAFGKITAGDPAGFPEAMAELFGDEQWAHIRTLGLSLDDLEVILEEGFDSFGIDAPNLAASTAS